ncbi:3-hydroxyacyl-ACP dehydratase FabZ family protein [Candidatus Albibeggiatoa sp. nov. NOAA]|uniref:3-hydroxyacyl-ACP dehydratase FabZ family protein n=1 Tax=Candidatus Albibeggiatoa sp. nov. NOAA TaxID=3162724 RepID=UPI0032F39BF5|nr:beta-hydroxyacyl-ACP dehydratase [Thiotrichaceae bacterium]
MTQFNINKFKKQTLFDANVKNDLTAPINTEIIKNILPHREPFLFIDSIDVINLEQRLIKATRWIDPKDPLFDGHFPNNPIYPGVLQQEIMFQTCLALYYFVAHNTAQAPTTDSIIDAVGTRAYDVHNLAAVKPNDTVSIYCHILEYDDLLVTGLSQTCVGEKVCCIGKGEFYVT